jgi:hypothetical protein
MSTLPAIQTVLAPGASGSVHGTRQAPGTGAAHRDRVAAAVARRELHRHGLDHRRRGRLLRRDDRLLGGRRGHGERRLRRGRGGGVVLGVRGRDAEQRRDEHDISDCEALQGRHVVTACSRGSSGRSP